MSKIYDNYHKRKVWNISKTKERYREFENEFSFLTKEKKLKIFEIGCGDGALMKWFKDQDHEVSGVDINQFSIDNLISEGFNVKKANILNNLQYINDKYDLIICMDVLEHFRYEELNKLFAYFSKSLKSTSLIYVRVPNSQSPLGAYYQFGDPTHRSFLSLTALEYFSESHNLSIKIAKNSYISRRGFKGELAHLFRKAVLFTIQNFLSLIFYGKKTLLAPNISVVIENNKK